MGEVLHVLQETEARAQLAMLLKTVRTTKGALRALERWGPFVQTEEGRAQVLACCVGGLAGHPNRPLTLERIERTACFLEACAERGWAPCLSVFSKEPWCRDAFHHALNALRENLPSPLRQDPLHPCLPRVLECLEALFGDLPYAQRGLAPGTSVVELLLEFNLPLLHAISSKPEAFMVPPLTRKTLVEILQGSLKRALKPWARRKILDTTCIQQGKEVAALVYKLYPSLVTLDFWDDVRSISQDMAWGPAGRVAIFCDAAHATQEALLLEKALPGSERTPGGQAKRHRQRL